MANQNGRPIAPARKLVAAVVGTIAVFVMLFGLGMSSWAIVALGAAMLALAIGLGMVNVVRRGARAWVAGSAQVKAISEPPATSIYGRAELQIVIVAPGLPTSEVTVRDPRVPVSKWPHVGDTLPVTVDVDDMRRVRIDWDEAETRGTTTLNVPPAYYDEDLPDDDLLGGEPEPPPWANRDRQWGRGPDEPPPPPAPRKPDLDDTIPPPPRAGDTDPPAPQVIVRDAPGGPILEGQLVEPDYDYSSPLPQRARTATATAAPPRPAHTKPRPRPRPHAPKTSDPEPGTGTPAAPTTAAPPTPQAAAGFPQAPPAPEAEQAPPHDDIDLPLDGDPQPTPDAGVPATRSADDDLLGDLEPPPWQAREQRPTTEPAPSAAPAPAARAEPTQQARPRPRPVPSGAPTTGVPQTGMAPESSRTERPKTAPGSTGLAAAGAVVAAGVAAFSKALRGRKHEEPQPSHSQPASPVSAPEPRPRPAADPGSAAGVATSSTPASPAPAPASPKPVAPAPVSTTPVAPKPVTSTPVAPAPVSTTPVAPEPVTPAPASPKARPAAADASTRAASRPAVSSAETGVKAASLGATIGKAAQTARGATRREGSPWADLEGGFEPDERADDLITAYPSARPGPAGAIHGVGITVLVTRLERSVAFYREMLGFYEIDAGSSSAVLASGDTRLVLRAVHDLSAVAGRQIYLNLEVGDVEAVYEELKRKGVTFVHGPRPVNRGDKLELWAASFHDPDGHNIAVTQWRAIR